MLPVIDVTDLRTNSPGRHAVATEIGRACREFGFFYITGHGVDTDLQHRLETHSRAFFNQDVDRKLEIRMSRGGRAWRGYFPLGDELTSGRPDLKEGLYFGAELPPSNSKALHGPNLFPAHPVQLRETVLAYLDAMTALGHTLLSGIALSLDLPETHFADRYTADPLILFRIFNYPSTPATPDDWGVGEHTDYGLLTILKQDDNGGLQVKSASGWLDAPPLPNTFICNLGDMLDRLTAGGYRSTPHRVLPSRARDRLSWPFFFDPNFDADLGSGTYGDYLLAKIGKVFPDLSDEVL